LKLKISLIFALLFLVTPPVNAASITAIKPIVDLAYSGNEQVSDLLLTANSIVLIGTTEAASSSWISGNLGGTSDGFISSYSNTGTLISSTRLGMAANEIATAAALDIDGSVWVVGASSALNTTTPTPTPSKLLNPDNVVLIPANPINSLAD
jgi:hypothetical protein